MAATIASLGSAFTTTAGNKTVTATPSVGDLIVIIAVATGVTTTVADNGTGGTYTQVGTTRTGFSTSGNLQIFVRDNLVSSAVSTVYTATQTSSTGGGLLVFRVTGMTLTGAAAVRSSGGQSTGTAGTTPAPVLSLTPLSSNPIITAVASANTVAGSVLIQRAGYTEDFDNVYSTPATAMEVNHLASGETSATLTQGGTSTTAFASQAIELQFNSAPTTALNTPVDTATGISTTPTLNFTGTDADADTLEYEVQIASGNSFNATNYSESNYNGDTFLASANFGQGQSFTSNGGILAKSKFYLKKTGSPTGNAVAKLYAHTGTFGSSSLPTGAALAVSDNFDVSTLSTSYQLIDFNFTGVNQYSMVDGTNYVITVEYSGGISGNFVSVGQDTTSPTHPGNAMFENAGTTWTAQATVDQIFYLYNTAGTLIDRLSTTDAGFTAGHPFASAAAIDFTVQAGDTLANSTTYYWRVRAIDPTGSNTYGAWATAFSFTTDSGGGGGPVVVARRLSLLGVGL